MPTIPSLDNQSVFPSGQGLPSIGLQPPQGGVEFGKQIAAFGEHQLDMHNEAVVNDVYSNQFSPDIRNIVSDYKQKEGKDALDARDSTVEQLETTRTNYRDSLSNPVQRRAFDEYSRRRNDYELAGIYEHANQQQKVYEQQTHLDTLKNFLVDADNNWQDNDRWEQQRESGHLEIQLHNQNNGIPIDSEITKSQIREFDRSLYANRVYAISGVDPVLAKQQLGEDVDKIDPREVATLNNHLDAQINRNQAHGQVAYNAALTQVAQGVPLGPDALSKLKGQLPPDKYQDVVEQQTQAQALLHKPLQQAIDEVKAKKDDFYKNGSPDVEKSLRHIDTLEKTVNATVAQFHKDPFTYADQKLGLHTDPIQFTDLQNPAKQDGLVQQIQQRVATLDAVEKAGGQRPNSRGLLKPQEAANFGNVLTQIRPQGQADLMNRLFTVVDRATHDPDKYSDIVQQLFPGNKPLVHAALLGSTPTAKVDVQHYTEDGGFTHSITGDEASHLIYEGQRALNPPKSVKGEEGPKSEFKLPPDQPTSTFTKGMSQIFSDAAGNAFMGHPEQAEEAYKTFQAMYAGMAIRDGDRGDFGPDNLDRVTDRMTDAAAATLGFKITKRGGVDTIAPWGMNDAQFDDEVSKRLGDIPGSEPGIHGKFLQQWKDGEIGMLGVGYNKYWMVHNGQPIRNADGSEIEIDLNKHDSMVGVQLPNKSGLIERGLPFQSMAESQATRKRQPGESLAEFHNNPGNIMKSKSDYEGKIPGDGPIATFATEKDGIRAIASTLLSYQQNHGLNTVEGIINRYSPPSENKTDKLVKDAASEMGVDPKDKLDLTDNSTLTKFVTRIIRQENGKQPFDKAMIANASKEAIKKFISPAAEASQ